MGRSAWGLTADPDGDWRNRAACGPETAEWFWLAPSRVGRVGPAGLSANNRAAIRLCAGCQVRQECYDDAAAHPDRGPQIAGGVLWNSKGVALTLGLAPCGTEAAAHRHRRDGEPVDEACATAERERNRARRAA